MKMLKLVGIRGGGRICLLISAIAALSAAHSVFAEDAYIATSDETPTANTAYSIDTGYYVGPNTRIDAEFEFLSTAVKQQFIYEAGNEILTRIYVNGSGGLSWSCSNGGNWTPTDGEKVAVGKRYKTRVDPYESIVTLDVDGVRTYTYSDAFPGERPSRCTKSLKLFNDVANKYGNGAMVKLYSLKIYESGVLVRDYVPALQDGRAGLYDKVNETFITNFRPTRTTPLAYGGDDILVLDNPYIESDGTAVINTGWFMNPDARVEIDYAFTDAADPTPEGTSHFQQRLLGADTSGCGTTLAIYITGGGNLSMGVGDTFKNTSTGYAADTLRHTAVIDATARKYYYYNEFDFNAELVINTTGNYPVALFGDMKNAMGNSFSMLSKARIYRARFWTGDRLDRDFVPRVVNGVAGFEDVACGGFYTCAGLTASENTPTEMTGFAYIESDGTTYSILDTRYFPNYKTKVEVDFQMVSVQSGVVPFGEYGASGFTMLLFCNTENPPVFRPQAQDATYGSAIATPRLKADVARHTVVMDVPARNIEIRKPDGTVEVQGDMPETQKYTGTSSWPLTLFGSANNAYGTTQKNAKARIYEVKIWESDDNGKTYALRRHFKPALQGGIAGFYEEITGKFNSGEGFKAGGKIDECDETYIENNTSSKGSFDTGLKVTDKTKIVCDFMPLIVKNQMFPFEGGDSVTATNDQKRMFMRTYGNGSGNYAYACGGQLWKGSSIAFRQHIRRELTLDAKNKKFVIGSPYDNAVQTMTIAAFDCPNESSNTLKIFSNSGAGGNYTQGRLYGFKVYENDALVGDYVPICQGGTYGLVDKVSGKVLTKASGSVAFTGLTGNTALNDAFFNAPMRAEDAYIESDGTQAINLGYLTTPNTRYEIDYQLTATTKQYRPFGQADTSVQNLNAELYVQDTLNVAFGVGDTWKGHATGVASDTDRHVAFIDFANRECGYSGYKIFAFDSAVVCKNTAVVPMWLFAKGTNATGSYSNRAKMKLYAFRIYEAGKLVHEYLPYKNGDTVGLYDTMTGDVVTSTVSGSNAFKYGDGPGYGKFAGVKTVLTTDPVDTAVKPNKTATLSAFAPGAIRYIWTRNGEVIDGKEGETLTIEWQSPKSAGGPVVYAVTPVFSKKGAEVLGEEASAEVTMDPEGLMIIVR